MNPLVQFRTTALVSLVAFGLLSAAQAVSPPPDGGYPGGNTAEGQGALLSCTTGGFNTAVGFLSLRSDSTNTFNTAIGAGALLANTADQNTATGFGALLSNTTGAFNTANGALALFNNTEGEANTAVGDGALFSNTSGGNTAVGDLALFGNTTAADNTAIGWQALFNNTAGESNTAVGVNALSGNSTGESNTAVGVNALSGNTIGGFNVALGFDAGSAIKTANNVICIGIIGADVSSTTWIGDVYGVTTQSGTTAPVIVSDSGQLGTVASSERFKKDIATMDKASEAILSLRPVTFHYKSDTKHTLQFGLIAEEVAKVNPALVLPDKEGKPYSVRYDQVNAMLLNEFLKEHRKVETLEATIAQQHKDFQEAVAELKGQIQKVSAQLEVSKPAPQTVKNKE